MSQVTLHSGSPVLSTHKFVECEPCWGIAHDKNYRCVKWRGGNVVFSYAKRGDALCCHFAAKKDSLRLIKHAINDFYSWALSAYEWCKILLAFVDKPSVGRLISKVEFAPIAKAGDLIIYARGK